MIESRRHEYMLAPNEGVVTTAELMVLAERTNEFLEDTGLSHLQVVVSPVVSIPLPIVEDRPRVHPEMSWFPLFWLPEAIRGRYVYDDEGVERTESDAEWALRVIMQVSAAGLFNAEMGSWLDVLSTVGLDLGEPSVLDRVRAWQDGAVDPDLDRINLMPAFVESDYESVRENALMITPEVLGAQYALTGLEVESSINELLADPPDAEGLLHAASVHAGVAMLGWAENPSSRRFERVQDAAHAILTDLHAPASPVTPAQHLERLRAIAADVRGTYSLYLDTFGEAAAAGEGEPALTPSADQAPSMQGWD